VAIVQHVGYTGCLSLHFEQCGAIWTNQLLFGNGQDHGVCHTCWTELSALPNFIDHHCKSVCVCHAVDRGTSVHAKQVTIVYMCLIVQLAAVPAYDGRFRDFPLYLHYRMVLSLTWRELLTK